MKNVKRGIFLFLLITLFGFSSPFSWLFSTYHVNSAPSNSQAWLTNQFSILKSQARNIDDDVLRLGLIAYQNARKRGLDSKGLLTIIDYSKPSYEKRMWVFDLNKNRNMYNTWVSHGKNSGNVMATSFSNQVGSLKSSIGVFLTANSYMGKNGYSLRLRGLEHGINDNATKRAVVIHGARYASQATISRYGELGRSWGCPAISPELTQPLINTIKDNTLLVAYYPDQHWKSSSKFLTA